MNARNGFNKGLVLGARKQIEECLEVLRQSEATLGTPNVTEADENQAVQSARTAVEKIAGLGILSLAEKLIAS